MSLTLKPIDFPTPIRSKVGFLALVVGLIAIFSPIQAQYDRFYIWIEPELSGNDQAPDFRLYMNPEPCVDDLGHPAVCHLQLQYKPAPGKITIVVEPTEDESRAYKKEAEGNTGINLGPWLKRDSLELTLRYGTKKAYAIFGFDGNRVFLKRKPGPAMFEFQEFDFRILPPAAITGMIHGTTPDWERTAIAIRDSIERRFPGPALRDADYFWFTEKDSRHTNPVHPGDVVVVPYVSNDTAMNELHELVVKLKEGHPGISMDWYSMFRQIPAGFGVPTPAPPAPKIAIPFPSLKGNVLHVKGSNMLFFRLESQDSILMAGDIKYSGVAYQFVNSSRQYFYLAGSLSDFAIRAGNSLKDILSGDSTSMVTVQDGIMQGPAWSLENGQKFSGAYHANARSGDWVSRDEKGRVRMSMPYQNGLLEGKQLTFAYNQDTLILYQSAQFVGGLQDGPDSVFVRGRLNSLTHFRDGKKDGSFAVYFPDGTHVREEGSFLKGELHGPYRGYREPGKVCLMVTYVNGKKEGKEVWTNPEGKRIISRYKNGVKQ